MAVSGGADSLCLLDVLVTLYGEQRDELLVGHVDHGLRPESAEDAEHVRRLAESYGLHCERAIVDVRTLAQQESVGIEAAARVARYRALSTIASSAGAHVLLTGHTRSDNVETVLMHLLRGTGTRGLAGIALAEYLDPNLVAAESVFAGSRFAQIDSRRFAISVIRPLLNVDRDETAAYCQARGLTWQDDPSNADPTFLRNRVRQHLLPVLRTYNPNVDAALERLATMSREDEEWFREIVNQRVEGKGIAEHGEGWVSFELVGWWKMPVALRRRVVRRVASDLDVRELGFEAVERALAVSAVDGPARAELPGGLTVERAEGRLVFSRATLRPRGKQTGEDEIGRGGPT